jgi:hypothetical protein
MENHPPNLTLTVSSLPLNSEILIETEHNVWSMKVILIARDGESTRTVISLEGTDHRFRGKPPMIGRFVGSYSDEKDFVAGVIVKGWCFEIRFADVNLISMPVQTVGVIAPTWSYDVIT